jgi:AMIN domain
MKTATKLTTGILAVVMVGAGWAPKAGAQNADAIDNARSTAKSLQQQQANPSNAAAKPAPGAPAPAVKPAAIPGSKPAAAAAKPAAASAHNQLQKVNVVQSSDTIQIEINSSQAVTPDVTKLDSPARILVALPDTIVASSQNKIPVGSAGVKSVRIGMDGKTPPTTSVVVDLEKALSYELSPANGGKVILTLHTQGGAPAVAKNTSAPAKAAPTAQPKPVAAASKPAVEKAAAPKAAVAKAEVAKTDASKAAAPKTTTAKADAAKPAAPAAKGAAPAPTKVAATAPAAVPGTASTSADPFQSPMAAKAPKQEEKKWAMNGKRDPFFSPVVQTNGSGCSTGKKCLEIGAINLRGVVKSDTGFIAVVTNNLNKAYFLRENDPVFNGYVVKITGDSVVFQETIQDKLGKPFTREVVKRIFTPAV